MPYAALDSLNCQAFDSESQNDGVSTQMGCHIEKSDGMW